MYGSVPSYELWFQEGSCIWKKQGKRFHVIGKTEQAINTKGGFYLSLSEPYHFTHWYGSFYLFGWFQGMISRPIIIAKTRMINFHIRIKVFFTNQTARRMAILKSQNTSFRSNIPIISTGNRYIINSNSNIMCSI